MTVNFARAHFAPKADVSPSQIIFRNVGKIYRPRRGTVVSALDTIDFDIRRGEIFGIIGRSGAGKSTLVRLINGLERPSTGTVSVDGLDVAKLGAKDLIGLRRRIGMIFQGFNLLSSRTTLENVALPLILAGHSRKAARSAALAALDLVGLGDKAEAYPARLSGGQRQRAGIARAIVGKPDLLLSDEATSALDPETTRSILALLRDINRRLGITIVLITHEMDVIRHVADRVAVLDTGRLVEIGAVEQVFGNPSQAATRALLRPDDGGSTNDAPSIDKEAIVSIEIGDHAEAQVDLFAIATALGPGARLKRGGIDGVDPANAGRLYLALGSNPPGGAQEALARLRAIHPNAEILRHAR